MKMKNVCLAIGMFLVTGAASVTAMGQSGTLPLDGVDARTDAAEFAGQLGHADPLVRQRAAEAIARLAATDQRKVVEGYQLQEKNKEVRLALDWALYRMGKEETLFRIVRELNSSRHYQVVGYLKQLDSAQLLYPFLQQNSSRPKVTVGLLEVLAHLGDSDTLEHIKPLRDSFASGVAEAAEVAIEQIEARVGRTEAVTPSRPRTVSSTEPTSP
jgi:HEAT repeat protein